MANLGRQERELTKIAALQKFDGSFSLDDQLASTVGISIRSLREVCTRNNWREDGWATAVVLAFFATRLADLLDDWELLADKSKYFLEETFKEEDELSEKMFAEALNLFPN